MPGSLCAALFPAIIGTALPRTLYLSQTLKFRNALAVRLSQVSGPRTSTALAGLPSHLRGAFETRGRTCVCVCVCVCVFAAATG